MSGAGCQVRKSRCQVPGFRCQVSGAGKAVTSREQKNRCQGPEKQRRAGPPLLKSREQLGRSAGDLPNPPVAETWHLTPETFSSPSPPVAET